MSPASAAKPKPVDTRERRWRRERFAVLSSRFSVLSLGVIRAWAAFEVLGQVIDEGSDLVPSQGGLRVNRVELLGRAIALIEASVELALKLRAGTLGIL
jgi:uncharacterized protein (DUF1810 family)